MDKISVLMPAYNVAAYIEYSIGSILDQTYPDWELIIVDDGSQDDTLSNAEKFASEDHRIRVFHQSNSGVAAARNRLLQEATGEYIAFVDSDDVIHPDYLKALYEALECTGKRIARCGYYDVDSLTDRNRVYADKSCISAECQEVDSYDFLAGKRDAFTLWGFLFQRSLWENITFPNVRIAEDTAVLYRLLYQVEKVAVIDHDFLYAHLVRKDGLIGKGDFSEKYLDRLKVLEEKRRFWQANGEKELEKLTILAWGMELLNDYAALHSAGNSKETNRKYTEEMTKIRSLYRKNTSLFVNSSVSMKQKLLFLICYMQPLSWKLLC
ncbi:MAG: glycosyltransferase family 2 protein [Lachnospiraceae bacterium]|nr:glycosyltransferase family 2 protein [Lachnospiraceae bacterium]